MKNVKRSDWLPKKRATAITLRKEGYSYRAIADKSETAFDCSIENKHGKGRKKVPTPTTERMISRQALQNRRITAKEINSSLKVAQISISDISVRRLLVDAGLKARIPRKKPLLNTIQKKTRVEWAKVYATWTVDQWKKVIWSDETRISIFGNDGTGYVCQRAAYNGVGQFKVVNGKANASKYIKDIVKPSLLPSARKLFLQWD
ncbi:uncharacterized protein LOC124806974 [Hydra vulgaris]|uniref:uncharacterized protein LOC124806974 n=1 Tax=Hydra vulgaris TaxID=6087 RepID=UPI001F5E5F51|nr:uncharacterized protein LOC124806974 [Hydra vulgaris]